MQTRSALPSLASKRRRDRRDDGQQLVQYRDRVLEVTRMVTRRMACSSDSCRVCSRAWEALQCVADASGGRAIAPRSRFWEGFVNTLRPAKRAASIAGTIQQSRYKTKYTWIVTRTSPYTSVCFSSQKSAVHLVVTSPRDFCLSRTGHRSSKANKFQSPPSLFLSISLLHIHHTPSSPPAQHDAGEHQKRVAATTSPSYPLPAVSLPLLQAATRRDQQATRRNHRVAYQTTRTPRRRPNSAARRSYNNIISSSTWCITPIGASRYASRPGSYTSHSPRRPPDHTRVPSRRSHHVR